MALPTSRNTNYAAGIQVKSADLNDLQDEIIALHLASFNASQVVTLGVGDFHAPAAAGWVIDTNSEYWESTGAGGYLVGTIPMLAGHRITAATLYVRDTTDWPITGKLKKIDLTSGATTDLSDDETSADSGAFQSLALSGISTSAKLATETWQVWFNASTHAGLKVYGAAITISKP